ncbi:SDR family oxidoreductase [Candidatus Parabeggiatoa sp. HSG14]|uniref:SDR family oxidoreductase n=1 Tax=Candidatus Parabeggiatoa sp. HSG14 TaxID=3055593 RepID=UPI0025A7CD2A|nr:SDR family oxidoreductase [Thiotrichales bacterium HSG14]
MMTQKIALVTGANRGIGLEACRQLAKLNITVILGSRDSSKGQQVSRQLEKEGISVVYHQLDVTNEESVKQMESFVRDQYGHLDILVNNAGIFPDNPMKNAFDSTVDILRTAMETNLYGPFRLCQLFIPMMTKNNYGRIVNMSSGMGQLSDMNGGCPAYRTSKTALNALTRLFADELKDTNVLINSMCPGWVRTDMGGQNADRSVEEGVDTVIWLATLPNDGPSGGFFRDRQPIPW